MYLVGVAVGGMGVFVGFTVAVGVMVGSGVNVKLGRLVEVGTDVSVGLGDNALQEVAAITRSIRKIILDMIFMLSPITAIISIRSF
jgi:hypothetical protein